VKGNDLELNFKVAGSSRDEVKSISEKKYLPEAL
jgi:hypothetical protein